MASNGNDLDVRREVVDMLVQKIAMDRNPSIAMMNFVEELLTPDDFPAYVAVLMDKVKTEKYPSLAMIRRLIGFLLRRPTRRITPVPRLTCFGYEIKMAPIQGRRSR